MKSFLRKICNFFLIRKFIYKKGIEDLVRDSLTGLYDRTLLNEFAKREILRAKRNEYDFCKKSAKGEIAKAEEYKHYFCIIMADINGLKEINDQKGGHSKGDKALKKVADTLKESCREIDYVIRYGGDEFLVLLSETSKISVQLFKERVAKKLEEFKEFSLSVSMGSCFWEDGLTLAQMIKEADDNFYERKKTKKNKPEAI